MYDICSELKRRRIERDDAVATELERMAEELEDVARRNSDRGWSGAASRLRDRAIVLRDHG